MYELFWKIAVVMQLLLNDGFQNYELSVSLYEKALSMRRYG